MILGKIYTGSNIERNKHTKRAHTFRAEGVEMIYYSKGGGLGYASLGGGLVKLHIQDGICMALPWGMQGTTCKQTLTSDHTPRGGTPTLDNQPCPTTPSLPYME